MRPRSPLCSFLSLILLASTASSSPTPSPSPLPSPDPTPAPTLQVRDPTSATTTYFTGVSISQPPEPKISVSIHSYTPTSTCHPTIQPDKNGYVPPGECNALYDYYPSFGAAVLFSVLFGIVMVLHIGQAFYFKKVRSR